jgi:predicted nucleic-acid-binding protein
MIALDTNIVVRLLVRDDPAQTAQAAAVVRGNRVLLTTSVLLETEWVLRSRYRAPRATIAEGLRRLIDLDQLTLDHPMIAARALDGFESGLDFADALHLASSHAASEFVTFDRAFARRADRLRTSPPVQLCA